MATPLHLQSNIYTTPREIYEAVRLHFPEVKASIVCDRNDLAKMELTLAGNLVLTLKSAVDARLFLQTIKTLARTNVIGRFAGNGNLSPLDGESFSLKEKPLSEWQRFSRVMYESKGSRCFDVIIKYLKNPDEEVILSSLSSLGLAPNQVEKDLKEDDFAYFKDVVQQMEAMDFEIKKIIMNNFQIIYPKTFKCILNKIVMQECEGYAQHRPDFYQITVETLKKSVLGQDHAVKTLAAELAAQQNSDRNAIFLFVGPTGVGKTELAKAASKIRSNRFVEFRMNEFQGSEDVTKLYGTGTGLVGSTDKPHLAKALDPYATYVQTENAKKIYEVRNVVLLFDEFEKAHPNVKKSLLNFFDNGCYEAMYTENAHSQSSSNVTVQYNLIRCIIINTSNLYQTKILTAFQQGKKSETISDNFRQWNSIYPLPTSLAPELFGRITAVIPFGPIPKGECYQKLINAKLTPFLYELKKEISCREVIIANNELTLSLLEGILYGDGVDVRRVVRYLAGEVKRIIYMHKRKWGNLKSVKIIIFPDAGQLLVKVEKFVDQLGIYHPLDLPPILLPTPNN